MKGKLSFILTLISIIGVFLLSFFKNTDITGLLPTILGIFVLGRSATTISNGWAVSKDPNANTEKVIGILDNNKD